MRGFIWDGVCLTIYRIYELKSGVYIDIIYTCQIYNFGTLEAVYHYLCNTYDITSMYRYSRTNTHIKYNTIK